MVEEFENILLRIIGKLKIKDWHPLAIQEIGFEIFKKNFGYFRKAYDVFWSKLSKNPDKLEKFDDVIKFYYFWCKRPSVYKVTKPDFKLIVMFSIIETLMSESEFVPLDSWLVKEMKENKFSIQDASSLNDVLEKYYNKHGSGRKIHRFFENYYSKASLEKLKSFIKIWNKKNNKFEPANIKQVIDFIIGIRNLFIHNATNIQISSREKYDKEAEGYTDFGSTLATSIEGKAYAINEKEVHIEELLIGFEEGMLNFFKHN